VRARPVHPLAYTATGMRFQHPDRPEATVRLGYCLNVHPAETLDGIVAGLTDVAGPVARRVGGGAPFGVGPWLAAGVAARLATEAEPGARLREALVQERLLPFTFNAFPYGGFHAPGLKAGVYRPTWRERARATFTRDVGRVAAACAWVARALEEPPAAHVSVSSHCGGFHSDVVGAEQREEVATALAEAVRALVALEQESGVRVVLSLEPEPRSSANDTGALPALFASVREHVDPALARRHLGACLDACHAAVEYEDPASALAAATADGHPLGKLQFSSALRVDPRDDDARERLFALAEPVFLHQVTGSGPRGLVRAEDLPDAQAAWDAHDPDWHACEELRCHFHVPVDLDRVGAGLATTRTLADTLLDHALDDPSRWGSPELHVEVETYTWDVLPPEARGTGGLIDGITRELDHVVQHLTTRGWTPT